MTVSMIIAVRDRGWLLHQTLQRLGELTPPDEIIVVDDGSVTRTVHGACENAPSHLNVKYLFNNRPPLDAKGHSPCQPRNVALLAASGDEILTTEPELLFMTDVVAQLLWARESEPDGVLHESWAYHEPRAGCSLEQCDRVPGFYAHLIKREWLMEVGGYDEAMPGSWGYDDVQTYGRLEYNGHSRIGIEGVHVRHMWHESRIDNVPADLNQAYCEAQEMPRDLIANKGVEWGRLLP